MMSSRSSILWWSWFWSLLRPFVLEWLRFPSEFCGGLCLVERHFVGLKRTCGYVFQVLAALFGSCMVWLVLRCSPRCFSLGCRLSRRRHWWRCTSPRVLAPGFFLRPLVSGSHLFDVLPQFMYADFPGRTLPETFPRVVCLVRQRIHVRVSPRPLVPDSHMLVAGRPEELWSADILGDDSRSVSTFSASLVRQRIHVHVSLRPLVSDSHMFVAGLPEE